MFANEKNGYEKASSSENRSCFAIIRACIWCCVVSIRSGALFLAFIIPPMAIFSLVGCFLRNLLVCANGPPTCHLERVKRKTTKKWIRQWQGPDWNFVLQQRSISTLTEIRYHNDPKHTTHLVNLYKPSSMVYSKSDKTSRDSRSLAIARALRIPSKAYPVLSCRSNIVWV